MRGVTNRSVPLAPVHLFLLTRLMRGVTGFDVYSADADRFLLTRLMRGVTSFLDTMSTTFGFLLTRLMRGVTLTPLSEPAFGKISTHTPHARRDPLGGWLTLPILNFYSHASCEA